jgi:hippurate hydrolase
MIVDLMRNVSREVPPSETAVVTVGRLQAGTKDNIIPKPPDCRLGVTTPSNLGLGWR